MVSVKMWNAENRCRTELELGTGLKSGIELGLAFNSTALFHSVPHSAFCLTSLFKPVFHTLSASREM